MEILLKAGGHLRPMLEPDVDYYTRRVETEEGKTIREILEDMNVNPSFVAFVYVAGKAKNLDYIPEPDQSITLQPPVSGG